MGKKKKTEKGHEIIRYGYRISTTLLEAGTWLVLVTQYGKADGGVRPSPAAERDGFKYEGEALDWGEDWALENRPLNVKVETNDHGFYAKVFDESGFDQYTTVSCEDAGEARSVADAWVAARRRHDLQVLELRRQARANYRMILADLEAQEADANATIDAAKGEIKTIEKQRDEAKANLTNPQITFNFVAELERAKALAGGKEPRQTDLEDKLGAANDGGSRARGAAGRARGDKTVKPEAPAPQ